MSEQKATNQIKLTDLWNPAMNSVWNDIAPYVIGRANRGGVPPCKHDELFLQGGRACVDGDTLIATPKGDVRIRDFEGGTIYAYDKDGSLRVVEACGATRYEPEEMYRLKCAGGAEVVCTAEHRFLTERGWVPCCGLKDGDRLLALKRGQSPSTSPSVLSRCAITCDALRESYYGGHHSTSPEDVLRSWRRLLGLIYRCARDYRLCDAQLLMEAETFQDVLRLLGDARTHSPDDSHTDGSGDGDNGSPSCQCESLRSTKDCLPQTSDTHCARPESEICETLSEWLSEIYRAEARSQTSEGLACTVRRVARSILESNCSVSSRSDGQSGSCIPRTLYDTLLDSVADDSYSDSFVNMDVLSRNRHDYIIGNEVRSIESVGKREFYDILVPFYNNYIGNGIIHHNSGKSYFASVIIWLTLENDPEKNAVIIRKVQSSLRKSCWKQMMKIRERLGYYHWRPNKTDMTFTNENTGQQIFFAGLDDEEKVRSITVEKGYISIAWFEEAKQFKSMEEIDQAVSSLLRGGAAEDEQDYDDDSDGTMEYMTILTYNPPKSAFEWINRESKMGSLKPTRLTHKSTYLTMPRKWLGRKVLNEIESMKKNKPEQYEHMYLGKVTGTGAEFFKNITIREITDEEIANFDYFDMGIDFGMIDPNVFTKSTLRDCRLYIFDEVYQDVPSENKYEVFAKMIKEHTKDCPDDVIWCDAQGKAEMSILKRTADLPVEEAKKHGKVGRDERYKYLQSLLEIVIDPKRCPNCAEEFSTFESMPAPGGEGWLDKPGKRGDHCCDCVSYAHWQDIEAADMGDDDGEILASDGDEDGLDLDDMFDTDE